ncbi:hypothetical protein JRC04_05200 [Mycolicibacterium sp. S2-37]|uniref:hypothetical protein n=1 Tax=Mycolicibacterium sp. S2-37 TaxID=2810297 RepID=UPI001A94A982|nr:hypothetical protein [Mycolicibacterium sp. S2-37]MBO0676853.1 hypothetical protein [Mycolicibacterium sp. S2-37]
MPKEYIGADPQEHGSLSVSWGRDQCHVALSVAGPIGWRNPLVEPTPYSEEAGFDPDNGLDWHFNAFNRSEINALIRVLRKARDQAFGRDE